MKVTLSVLSCCYSRRRLCYASLGITLLVMVMPFMLGASGSQPAKAVALFQVDFSPHLIRGDNDFNVAVQSFDIFKKTQLAKLKSNYVLVAALQNPDVTGLSILTNEKDQVEWLDQHLTVDFPQDGEVLRLTLSANGPPDQVVAVLNAVAKAYQNEVVAEELQRRLGTRDILARNLKELNQEIKEKLNTYLDIARESDIALSPHDVKLQLILTALNRIDGEILKIESAQALSSSKEASEQSKNAQEWLARLQKRHAELAKQISERSIRSADLEIRKDELTQLQKVANDLASKLEQLELDVSGPERIRMLQPAVLSTE